MVLDKHDLKKLRENGKNIDELIESFDCKTADDIRNNCESYEPNHDVVKELIAKAKDYTIVVFSADWCKDCKINTGAFAKIVQLYPEIDAVFFKGIKSAPLDPDIKWKVPPSPPEVNEFPLNRLPTFYILDSEGYVKTELLENPVNKPSVEEELLYLIENI
ncbi:MAG: TlpA family protein disulfide reductase [Candidatus Heimdallarchaeota archaeon]